MIKVYNPALSEEPRNNALKLVPPVPQESLMKWLESTGRFKASEQDDTQHHSISSEELDDFLEPDVYPDDDDDDDPMED
jgi:hypothetical protein